MSISRPAGVPAIVMANAWPWDSPAVRNLKIRGSILYEETARSVAPAPADAHAETSGTRACIAPRHGLPDTRQRLTPCARDAAAVSRRPRSRARRPAAMGHLGATKARRDRRT